MSDSKVGIPSEATLSRGLRDAVIAIYRSGNEDDLTVKRVRARAEQNLDLPAGYFKSEHWKQKSNDLIREAVEKYCVDDPAPPAPKPTKAPPKKRKAAATPKKPQKKRRKADLSDDSGHEQPSEAESEPPQKVVRRQKKVVESDSDLDMEEKTVAQEQDRPDKVGEAEGKRTQPPGVNAASDSELSSLIDESPVKKRRKKDPVEKNTKAKSKNTKAGRPRTAPKAKVDEDPHQAEIKRLQSWLVKCGIRKVWGKELANCDTTKDKIRHLKGMLKEAGMDGKYSNEKAAQIKERREFAKDLEEIQAGALAWGDAGKADIGRPRRSAARAKPIPKPVVLSDDDDEEAQDEKDVTDDDDDDDQDEDAIEESPEDEEGDGEDTDSD